MDSGLLLLLIAVPVLAALISVFLIGTIRKRAPWTLKRQPNHAESDQPFDFDGESRNDKVIVAPGASEQEVRAVLGEFAKAYRLEAWSRTGFSIAGSADSVTVRFPRDIPAQLFVWLVNFLKYPIESKAIENVFGLSPLGNDFAEIGCPVVRGRAAFYTPTPDPRGDIVRVLTDSHKCWDYTWDRKGG